MTIRVVELAKAWEEAMAKLNTGQILADELERSLRESPDPFSNAHIFDEMLGLPRMSYRDRLDEQPVNCYGQLIPRIVTIRRNARMYGFTPKNKR